MSMLDRAKAASLLNEAAEKIEAAVGYLNTTRNTCDSCGASRHVSRDEGKVAERLQQTPKMLRDNANRLAGLIGEDE